MPGVLVERSPRPRTRQAGRASGAGASRLRPASASLFARFAHRSKESHQIAGFLIGEIEGSDVPAEVRIRLSPAPVELHDFFESLEASVVHEGGRAPDLPEARSPERAQVLVQPGQPMASGIPGAHRHAGVVEAFVGERGTRVTGGTPRPGEEESAAAHLRLAQGISVPRHEPVHPRASAPQRPDVARKRPGQVSLGGAFLPEGTPEEETSVGIRREASHCRAGAQVHLPGIRDGLEHRLFQGGGPAVAKVATAIHSVHERRGRPLGHASVHARGTGHGVGECQLRPMARRT